MLSRLLIFDVEYLHLRCRFAHNFNVNQTPILISEGSVRDKKAQREAGVKIIFIVRVNCCWRGFSR